MDHGSDHVVGRKSGDIKSGDSSVLDPRLPAARAFGHRARPVRPQGREGRYRAAARPAIRFRDGDTDVARSPRLVDVDVRPACAAITYPSLSRWRCVNLPRKALAPLVPEIDDVAMRPIPGDSEALRLLIDYFVALDTSPLATPELQHLAANHVLDLVAVMLGATRDAADVAQGRGMRAARLAAIKAGIAKNLHGVGLSIDALAAQNGVSTRHVQLLFEDEGTTFTQFVLAERLARAHRILTDARFADRPISTIAFAAGFGDLSYFNRTFRRRFGATPSDVRAAASARDKT
jgi:AraC-like DNA-binding protein